jgi:type IV pilus assembly protein PilM
MAKSVVGIDIGARVIRAAEVLERAKHQPMLLRYHEIALPSEAAVRGEVLEIDTVASALKQLWSAGGFKSKQVVLGVGSQRVLARDLTVPKMPIEQIRESLPFQVQDMLPVPVADALLDFYPVSEDVGESGVMINGLLIAAVKDSVMANVRAAQAAGLNPLEVDLIPFALSRALLARGEEPETVAMVHVGAVTTSIVVAKSGIPQFVRIVPSGGDDVTKALVSRLKLEVSNANQVKRAFGLTGENASAEWQPAIAIVREVASELLNTIRNTINFFAHTRPRDPISRIVVSGGGSQLVGLQTALSEITRLPVSESDPFERFTIEKTVDREALEASRASVATVLGLTLGGRK